MKSLFKSLSIIALTFFTVISCTKDDVEPIGASDKNNVSLEFDNLMGGQKIVLGSTTAKNAAGEDFTITTLNYYISNVSLKKVDGSKVDLKNQYFLVRQADSETLIQSLKDVPAADYKEVTFTIGVDSVKSISPVEERTGVLDPAGFSDDGMYWSWNSGYIFMKLEGTSSAVAANAAGLRKYQYHVGGFGGRTSVTANNLRTVTLSLPSTMTVRKSIAPTIHFVADVTKVFSGTTTLKLADAAVIMSPALATPIANNYKNMFVVDHVHND
ncbi:hypothetical protein GOQ04_17895 [Emticicia sp. ODNR4P]|jgi:hypothetical protein|nr:hypothetical protein [Emticicia sp. ODNR4P]